MAFNYAKEKLRFEEEWVQLRKTYQAAGMSTEQIQSLYDFDWAQFLSRYKDERRAIHWQDESIGNAVLTNRLRTLCVAFDEDDFIGRYAWVESLNDSTLAQKLKRLPTADLELLTLYALEQYSQKEIAVIMGCTQANISKKITRLKKYLK